MIPFPAGQTAPLLFLMGPTASGKSELALRLGERFAAAGHGAMEILNADSVQLYRGLEIGSAKPSAEELSRLPHHLLDLTDPGEPFSADRYRLAALDVIADCHKRGVLPMLVGGSGLYFRAVEKGLAPVPPVPEEILEGIRAEARLKGWEVLHQRLLQVDPAWGARVTPRDAQRIGRGLSVFQATGTPLSEWCQQQDQGPRFPILKLAITCPRERLYPRIEARFDWMMAHGLLEEVTSLHAQGHDRGLPAMKAVGYRQLFRHLDGEISLEEAISLAKRDSRRYAKRQMTWLRREPGLIFLGDSPLKEALARVVDFLDSQAYDKESGGNLVHPGTTPL
ncbi:MAG: tRNA (adenosine(37)-N6)-dimethylallyltransferase MiaA [Magnetococcales bacterium]|nr:tRNA (adenosine(37)-N6)-dimethylallyltransferase MiaA [Magnetococcales bacterium]